MQRGSITQQLGRFDIEGTLCFVPGVIALLLALQWGGTKYPWSDGHIIGLLVLCFVLLAAFLSIQIWKQDRATIPPHLFRNRTLWACFCFIGFLCSALTIFMYYLPLWFQGIQGSSAFLASVKLLPLILGLVVFALVTGALVGVCDYYTPFLMASSVCMSIGAGFLSTLRIDSAASAWIGYQCLFGFGIGLGIQQPVIAVQTSLEPEHVAIGTALLQFSQSLGGAVFVSVAQNIFQNKLASSIISAGNPEVDLRDVLALGATQFRQHFSGEALQIVVDAYNMAITSCFYVAAALGALSFVCAAFVPWNSVKKTKTRTAVI
ncbi:hypothetical protein NLG97_g3077 [Lecanicillium saksenae]|uniref:Uncharacterized protein n=1 Tax=Lecanicillium saksenae TaxID=468837 RepID=A0ACC1QZR0_9HYPO|nr:hypothetical protein NLG97_g3077 [Lecanicillium saksenae]